MPETHSTLANSFRDLKRQKEELERVIADLRAGREEEITERALGRSRQVTFDRRVGEQIADLEYELEIVNEALAVNGNLKNDPEIIANELHRAEQRQVLDNALTKLTDCASAVDTAMMMLRAELTRLDEAHKIARELRSELGIAPTMHNDDFSPDVLTARLFGALSTHGLASIIPPEELRTHGTTMAKMIEVTALQLRKDAELGSPPVNSDNAKLETGPRLQNA